jgi:hypothetical protein
MDDLELSGKAAGQVLREILAAISDAGHGKGTWLLVRGERAAMILPPDVALRALAQLHEDQRLSRIATAAAGLPPESAQRPAPGETVILPRPGEDASG